MADGKGQKDAHRPSFDKEEVKARLKFLDLLAHEGIAVRRSGPNFVAICPFHTEGTGSFTVHGPAFDHAHCYGCGWNGDIFTLWSARHGGGFVDALAACASLASVSPAVFEHKRQQASQVTRVSAVGRKKEKPALPRLRALSEDEIEALARVRGLDPAGLRVAAAAKRIGGCEWPQWIDRDGCWRKAEDAGPCWFITDSARNVIQYRRLDGAKFTRKDGKAIKAWTKGSPTWPVGASEMGERVCVLLCEGGPDMLAGYHFVHLFRRERVVAIVGMLGASCAICDEALPFFAGKRVRIFMHADVADAKTGKVASFEAAARWTEHLTQVGAAVECFRFDGLLKKDGGPVEDLNDLALAEESAWLDPEVRGAFFDFDF